LDEEYSSSEDVLCWIYLVRYDNRLIVSGEKETISSIVRKLGQKIILAGFKHSHEGGYIEIEEENFKDLLQFSLFFVYWHEDLVDYQNSIIKITSFLEELKKNTERNFNN